MANREGGVPNVALSSSGTQNGARVPIVAQALQQHVAVHDMR